MLLRMTMLPYDTAPNDPDDSDAAAPHAPDAPEDPDAITPALLHRLIFIEEEAVSEEGTCRTGVPASSPELCNRRHKIRQTSVLEPAFHYIQESTGDTSPDPRASLRVDGRRNSAALAIALPGSLGGAGVTDALQAELSAARRPFVLGRGQADSCSRDRQGRGRWGRGSREPARGDLKFFLFRVPLATRRRPRGGALGGAGVASPGRDGSLEEWGGRRPRVRRALRARGSMRPAKGGSSSPSSSLRRRLPRAPALSPPRTMQTPGLPSPRRSPCRLPGPR
ncbi:uncharacterized protein LOC123936813 [Meles meles]|uniref:uncharacterized protein LOC123936813 n=1 Tax=Meles meles TaxID=9662 RepID=UPI001E69F58F|nr:uncharacterized protein LOC123936813 [Meles meles]